ncbi:4d642ed2-10fc-40f2-8b96-55540c1f1254 [Sclerotinia trifoliorum]|uniref:4d642ed2-10fc-40f2-8b96-55540c1f1254 n=1 Tax=Sclerotinia trifoliorum TaxID=28548 RepID=A0A8H2W4G7_9HELO|nr:4d642ed2-10fc-40f2-8b96-55540c1f1254 [Sclerotinia trifoliorum]
MTMLIPYPGASNTSNSPLMSSNDAYLQESRVQWLLVGTILPAALGTMFVVGHLYTRAIITKILGWDDFCLVTAWILVIFQTVGASLSCDYGGGRHVELQRHDDLKPLVILAFVSRLLYQLGLMMVRIAMCLLYLRIFQDKTSKIIIYLLILFQLIATIPATLALVFQCDPIISQWDPNVEEIHCDDPMPAITAFTVCSVLSDAALIAFAVPRVLPLQIPKLQKAFLLAIVSFGILIIIVSIIRYVRLEPVYSGNDYTWDMWQITTFASIELNTALFCASAPSLRPLVRALAPNIKCLRSLYAVSENQRTRIAHSRVNLNDNGEMGEGGNGSENDELKLVSRSTVGGSEISLDSGRAGSGRIETGMGRRREEMSVRGSGMGSKAIVGRDAEDWMGLVGDGVEDDKRGGVRVLGWGLGKRRLVLEGFEWFG